MSSRTIALIVSILIVFVSIAIRLFGWEVGLLLLSNWVMFVVVLYRTSAEKTPQSAETTLPPISPPQPQPISPIPVQPPSPIPHLHQSLTCQGCEGGCEECEGEGDSTSSHGEGEDEDDVSIVAFDYTFVDFALEAESIEYTSEDDIRVQLAPDFKKVARRFRDRTDVCLLYQDGWRVLKRTEPQILLRIVGARTREINFTKLWTIIQASVPVIQNNKWVPYNGLLHPEKREQVNAFKGFVAETVEEDRHSESNLQFLLKHIRECFCGGNMEYFNYFISWCARIIVDPENKTGICLVLYSSKQGSGKGIFLTFLRQYVFGLDVTNQTNQLEPVVTRFNAYLENKVLIVADDIGTQERGANFEKFKSLISEDALFLRPRHKDPKQSKNYCNFALTTNFLSAIQVESTDRRMFILSCADRVGNIALHDEKGLVNGVYFEELSNRTLNPATGRAFMRYCMEAKTIPIAQAPRTEAWQRCVELSRHSHVAFIDEVKNFGVPMEYHSFWTVQDMKINEIRGQSFYDIYGKFCQANGLRRVSSTLFGEHAMIHFPRYRSGHGMRYKEVKPATPRVEVTTLYD